MIQQNFRSMIVCNFILTNSMGKLVYSDYSFSVLIIFWFQLFFDGRKKSIQNRKNHYNSLPQKRSHLIHIYSLMKRNEIRFTTRFGTF